MMLADFSGDGRLELFCSGDSSAFVYSIDDAAALSAPLDEFAYGAVTVRPVTLDPEAGPGLLMVKSNGPYFWGPGEGRFSFASVELTGEIDAGDSMRSNAEGLGTRLRVRQQGRWSVLEYPPASSFPELDLNHFRLVWPVRKPLILWRSTGLTGCTKPNLSLPQECTRSRRRSGR